MSNDHDAAIRKAVQNLIDAENKGDSKIVEPYLSETFIAITRSKGIEQNRVKLIEAIDSSNKKIRRELHKEHFRVLYYGNAAISRSLVIVKEEGKEDSIFRNIHVFENDDKK